MFENYQVNENYHSSFKEGDFFGFIKKVEAKKSTRGNAMLVVTIEIEGQGDLLYYLVDDTSSEDAFNRRNQNLTRFFDCFKIKRGNFNIKGWVGSRGLVRVAKQKPDENGKQYFEIKTLLVEQNQNNQSNDGSKIIGQNRQQPQNIGYVNNAVNQGSGQNYGSYQNYGSVYPDLDSTF